ncbi:MAG: glycosyltransferase, partial [Clostridia bacterium]|nr:glycosyltransferase [Clostridia bacterium]
STVLYNIIDTESVCRNAEEDPNQYPYDVIYIGRLTYQKNPQRLMEVFSKVAKQRPGTKFAVVGVGELEEETKKLAQQLNLEKNVDFLGFRKNPHKMLKGAKVMVMTSRWEGTPMCALEAQALGVPIVSTPADGLTALVKNDETGYLSESDDVLAEKILQVLNNKDLHQSLSVNAVAQSKGMNNKEQYKKTIWAEYPERNSCSAVPN